MPWTRAARGDRDAESADVLTVVTGVRTGTGDDRAGDERDRGEQADRDGVAADLGRHGRTAAPVVGLRRSVDEHDGVRDEDERHEHVALDGERVQVDQDRDPAEHDLAEHPADESERQVEQVLPARHPPDRAEHGGDDRRR